MTQCTYSPSCTYNCCPATTFTAYLGAIDTKGDSAQIPKVRFIPIKRRLCNNNIASQEAVNFLTKWVWTNSPDIFTLHTEQTQAHIDANMPRLWTSGDANGVPHHRRNNQQLQTADAWPHHSWNTADCFWERFWGYGARQSEKCGGKVGQLETGCVP